MERSSIVEERPAALLFIHADGNSAHSAALPCLSTPLSRQSALLVKTLSRREKKSERKKQPQVFILHPSREAI